MSIMKIKLKVRVVAKVSELNVAASHGKLFFWLLKCFQQSLRKRQKLSFVLFMVIAIMEAFCAQLTLQIIYGIKASRMRNAVFISTEAGWRKRCLNNRKVAFF